MRPAIPAGRDGRRGRYLPRNDAVYTPALVMAFDTESRRMQTPQGETHTLRLWTARIATRRAQKTATPDQAIARGHTGADLAAAVTGWMRSAPSLWIYAHNLGYDLPVSGLVGHLGALGWSVSECSSDPAYVWLIMRKGKQSITISDLYHLLPMRLADIGGLCQQNKMPMPKDDAPDSAWFEYCQNDADIVLAAVLILMQHWDDYALGKWRMTGASCGFATMRHTHDGARMVLFDDPDGSALDRRAIYGGRRHAWRHGQLPPGRYVNLDITAAYATAGAMWNLPHKRGATFQRLALDDRRIWRPEVCVIAEVELETDRPVFPVRAAGGIAYPVGRFRTVLAGPEIEYARQLGMLREIGAGQFHLLGQGMRSFFARVTDWGRPGVSKIDPVAAAMWKQFGRGVVGKFAQRGYVTEVTNLLTDKDWFYEQAYDLEHQRSYWLVHRAGRIERRWQEGDARNSYPAVTAVVESLVRVALDRVITAAGPDAPVLCDTDGLWLDMSAHPDLPLISAAALPFGTKSKDVTERLEIAGPQSYDWAQGHRHAGRPRNMQRTGPDTWAGDVFPGLAWQMAHGKAGEYHLVAHTWRQEASTIRAWVLDSGHVAPLEVTSTPEQPAIVLPWPQTRWARSGACLGPAQHADLAALWDHPRSSKPTALVGI